MLLLPRSAILPFPFQRENLGALPPLSHHHSPSDLQELNLFLKLFQVWLRFVSGFRGYQWGLTLQSQMLDFLKKNQNKFLAVCYCWNQAIVPLSTSCNWLTGFSWVSHSGEAWWHIGTLRQNIEATTPNILSVFWEFSIPLGSSKGLFCIPRKKALSLVLYLSLH